MCFLHHFSCHNTENEIIFHVREMTPMMVETASKKFMLCLRLFSLLTDGRVEREKRVVKGSTPHNFYAFK